jgi:hypothetical protein
VMRFESWDERVDTRYLPDQSDCDSSITSRGFEDKEVTLLED